MDSITIARIGNAHPRIREVLLQQYKEINNRLPKGVRLRFSAVFRTPAEQDIIFKQRPKVTNSKAWQSIHNYGLAFDVVILRDMDENGTFETAKWDGTHFDIVVKYFKSKGYKWGGDFRSFKDSPHFEITFGHTWRTLKEKIDKGEFIENSAGFKYPLL